MHKPISVVCLYKVDSLDEPSKIPMCIERTREQDVSGFATSFAGVFPNLDVRDIRFF